MFILSSLAPWGDENNASAADKRIADQMSWLPTSRDQDDPFYPGGVAGAANNEDASNAAKLYRTEIYKAILARLRDVDLAQLKAGTSKFEEAAKGAAAYAFRNAAMEVAFGIDGKWLEVAEYYFKGHWPCGVTPTGKLVII